MIEYFKKLSFQTLIYGLGDMIVKAINFLLIPLYARHLAPDEYGVYSLVLTFQFILVVILGLGFSSAIFKVYNDVDSEDEKNEVISTALIFLSGWGILAIAVFYFSSGFIAELIWSSTERAILLKLLFAAVFFDMFRLLALALLRAREQPVSYSIINIVNLLVLVGLNIWNVAIRQRGVQGILESLLTASILISISLGIILFRKIGFRFSVARLKALLNFGIPLVPSGVAAWGLSATSIYFIHHYWNETEVGYFGLGFRFGAILNMLLVRPFRTAWLPFMFSIQKEERANRVYSLALTYFVLAGSFVFLGLSVLGREIVTLAATTKYLDGYHIIPYIALAYLFYGMYNTVDVGVLVTSRTKIYALVTICAAILQIGLNLILVPRFGISGAAVGMMLSYMALFIAMYFTSRHYYTIRYEWNRLLKIAIVTFLIYRVGLLLERDAVLVSIGLKICVILAYPFLLWAIRFFHPQEMATLKKWVKRRS